MDDFEDGEGLGEQERVECLIEDCRDLVVCDGGGEKAGDVDYAATPGEEVQGVVGEEVGSCEPLRRRGGHVGCQRDRRMD